MADQILITGLQIITSDDGDSGGDSPWFEVDAVIDIRTGGSASKKPPYFAITPPEVCDEIVAIAKAARFDRIEELAAVILDWLLERFPPIHAVELTLWVREPAFDTFTVDSLGVRLRKERDVQEALQGERFRRPRPR